MIENLKIRRGLLRLGRATVKELAEFAGANPSTVRNFLNDSGLCTKEKGLAKGRGRPTTFWTLTNAGRERLLKELQKLSSSGDPVFAPERLAALERIRLAIEEIEEEIDELEANRSTNEEFAESETRLRARSRALATGIRRLNEWQDQSSDRRRLERLERRLDRMRGRRVAVEMATEAMETSLSAGVAAWTRMLARDIGAHADNLIGEKDVFVPEVVKSLPFVVIDAADWSAATARVFEAARICNAPALRIPVLDAQTNTRLTLLDTVAAHCTEVVGAMARIVFTVDSRVNESMALMEGFERLDAARRHLHTEPGIGARSASSPPNERASDPKSNGPPPSHASAVVRRDTGADVLETSIRATLRVAEAMTVLAQSTSAWPSPAITGTGTLLTSGTVLTAHHVINESLQAYWIDAADPGVMHEGALRGLTKTFDAESIWALRIVRADETAEPRRVREWPQSPRRQPTTVFIGPVNPRRAESLE
jgi:predicted ArsR family transcriptional regulator